MYTYVKFSSIPDSNKQFMRKRIMKFLVPKLRFKYPGFKHWLKTKIFTKYDDVRFGREIIIAYDMGEIIGIAILKRNNIERKICCLYVHELYRLSNVGTDLFNKAFEYLETTKPSITMQYKEYKQFAWLLKDFKFELTGITKTKHKLFSKELEFNGGCLFIEYPLKKIVHVDENEPKSLHVYLSQQKENLINNYNEKWGWLSEAPFIRAGYWLRSPQQIGYYGQDYPWMHIDPLINFYAPYKYHTIGGNCKMKRTLVISAFPACGKSYYTEHNQSNKIILDSDSSSYSWINSTREATSEEYEQHRCMYVNDEGPEPIFMDDKRIRNPEFPANYIKHIKENIGKADIIFVSSHITVRQALTDAGINFITIYPSKKCKAEWIGRMYLRGNDKAFIDMQVEHWDEWIDAVGKEPHGKFVVYLNPWHFINDFILDKITEILDKHDTGTLESVVFGEFKDCN